MAIELGRTAVGAYDQLIGGSEFEVAAGQSLKIETSPDGEEVLDEECPVGKAWAVYVFVKIVETDA